MNAQLYRGTNADIEQLAARLRAKCLNCNNADLTSGILLRRLVELTGGKIEVAEDPSDQEVDGGSLVIRNLRDYTIFLSPYTTPLRDNFTIAHELGHYVLHYFYSEKKPPVPIWFARYGSSEIEWQANRFAAAILMPAEDFRTEYKKFDGNLSLLSGLFEVSLPAVEVRARSLGCLN